MSDATRAFRAAVWEALGRPVEADAEGMLDAGLSVATTAWGGLGVDPAYFGRHLGQRLDRGHPVSQQLPRLSFDDLYLAAACASGDSRAIAALEQRYATEIRSALSRVRHKFLQPEDFRQILRRKLFVGTETRPASIAQYAGQGALGVWIRVTALRTALNAARDERDADTPIDDEDLFDFEPSDDDPELDHLKRTYRDAFRAAFHETLAELPARERNLLRQSVVHGLSVREIARLYDVHHATIARWIAGARERLLEGTRGALVDRLGVGNKDLDSIMGLIESRLDASVVRVLDEADGQ